MRIYRAGRGGGGGGGGGGSVYLMLKNLVLRALMFTVSTLTLHCSAAQIRPRLIP